MWKLAIVTIQTWFCEEINACKKPTVPVSLKAKSMRRDQQELKSVTLGRLNVLISVCLGSTGL